MAVPGPAGLLLQLAALQCRADGGGQAVLWGCLLGPMMGRMRGWGGEVRLWGGKGEVWSGLVVSPGVRMGPHHRLLVPQLLQESGVGTCAWRSRLHMECTRLVTAGLSGAAAPR